VSLLDEARTYLEISKPGKAFIGLVHRLDRPSSGVVAFAKTSKAAARLSESFRNRAVDKHYVCVVNGHLKEKEGTLHDNLTKNSKAKVKILNDVTPLRGNQQRRGQGPGQGQPVVEARLHYTVRLEVTRPSGRNREQSLLHITLETG
jgi:23S rRNA-/tRNA-specific pseudouridylate synthase